MIRIVCRHAADIGRPSTVECVLGLFGGFPHYGVCLHCAARDKELTPEEAALVMQEAQIEQIEGSSTARMVCAHLGSTTGETIACASCGGGIKLKIFACDIFGGCTTGRKTKDIQCCVGCAEYEPAPLGARQVLTPSLITGAP